MKMRKLLPLVLLAIGSIFLLSSCDALLDAIYANNTITVTVLVSTVDYPGTAQNPSSYVVVTLSGASGGRSSASYSQYTSGVYAYYYPPSFIKQPNGNFIVTATYYGYSGGTYYQSSPQSISISMPYNGSNTADVFFYF